jgi:hypothetical protein
MAYIISSGPRSAGSTWTSWRWISTGTDQPNKAAKALIWDSDRGELNNLPYFSRALSLICFSSEHTEEELKLDC